MLTLQEIRQLNSKDLTAEIEKIVRELMKLKMDLLIGASKEIGRVKVLRKYIAQLKTINVENNHKELSAKKQS